MNNIIEGIWFEDEDFCSNCKNKHSLELYDNLNKPINYTLLLRNRDKLRDVEKNHILSHFKCTKCSKVYDIDWSLCCGIRFPIPFKENKYLENKFKNEGKY